MTADWLNIFPETGFTGQTNVYIDATANENVGRTRRATIRFTNEAGLYADLSLTQSSDTESMSFIMSPEYLVVPGSGGTFYVNITTNTYWMVTDYDSALTITSSSIDGYGDGVITIVFPVNDNTKKTGTITIETLDGTKYLGWEQAAYNAITVTPDSLIFSKTGGSLTATVSSSTDWELISYDSATTSISPMSGNSGQTVVTVTKEPLTNSQLEYYITKASVAVFSDGVNTAELSINSTIDDYYIDDDYVTVTYYVPEDKVNTDIFLYRVATGEKTVVANQGHSYYIVEPTNFALPSEVLFQDEYNTGAVQGGDFKTFVSYVTAAYYTKFTTPGYHKVKYKFPDNTLITKYMFSYSEDIVKVVVGNRCNGVIMACSVKDCINCADVILGLGTIEMIGEAAFSGCGSYDTDLVLTNGVKDLIWCPFVDFKARKFIYDKDYWGGDGSAQTYYYRTQYGYGGPLNIYGTNYGNNYFSARTQYINWSNRPGPFSCLELVMGQNVKGMYPCGLYPYGFDYNKSGSTAYFTYPKILLSFNVLASPITCDALTMLKETPPDALLGIDTALTMTRQEFITARYNTGNPPTTTLYKDFGVPADEIPFHYPTNSDYSDWITVFTNNYNDIDI